MVSNAFDLLLFAILPYVSLVVFFLGTVGRYWNRPFSYSSYSSQFLENRFHFWGLVPFHYGILTVIAGHIVAFLVPRSILLWNSQPLRLYILEASALAAGLLTLVGLVGIIVRRLGEPKVKVVTTRMDWTVYALLLVQVITGVLVAVFHPWGSSWFAAAVTPYLLSLLTFNPVLAFLAAMPFLVKLHFVTAFLLIGVFPFSRLVHILVVPNPYLWRRPQVVRWYRRPTRQAL
ncbi:MAG TPA: respiratory nitrate reductase subunit gamma [Vicinamibacterales bacterium]|nr:respiratory nitrate reductase subunit gamma [Vicinamibacterales bacterium]